MSKRKSISISEKYEILQKRKQGSKSTEIAKEYDLKSSTLSTIFSNEEKIISEYQNNMIHSYRKRLKPSKYPQLEEALDSWLKEIKENKSIKLNGPLIQSQALKYAALLKINDFKASPGWLENFKKRNNINWKSANEESSQIGTESQDNAFKIKLPSSVNKNRTKSSINNGIAFNYFYSNEINDKIEIVENFEEENLRGYLSKLERLKKISNDFDNDQYEDTPIENEMPCFSQFCDDTFVETPVKSEKADQLKAEQNWIGHSSVLTKQDAFYHLNQLKLFFLQSQIDCTEETLLLENIVENLQLNFDQ